MSEKADLLSDADAEFVKFKEALSGFSEAQMSEIWCGTWSARDIAAHISGWHREMIPRHHYQVHRNDIAAWRKSRGI